MTEQRQHLTNCIGKKHSRRGCLGRNGCFSLRPVLTAVSLFFFFSFHILFELILENWLVSSLKLIPLQSSKVSTQRRPGSISSAVLCFMKKKTKKDTIWVCVCVSVFVCECVKPHTCVFLQACRWVQQHAPCSILPSQVDVWVSELSFKSDSNYPESKPCMLFISIPVFFMPAHNFCACFSKDVLWNDLLPHPENQASSKKKKKEKKNPPTQLLCNSGLVSEVFQKWLLLLFIFFGG